MKKFLLILAGVALMLFAGCTKDNSKSNSEEGQWYCYEGGVDHTRLYLELKNGKADLIITAWGDRYQGPYTYKDETLTINWEKQICRGNAGELGENSTLTSNLLNGWPGETSADHITLEKPIVMPFKVNGDTAQCEFVGLNMEMKRK